MAGRIPRDLLDITMNRGIRVQDFKNLGFPSQFIQINQGVNGHTTRAAPGVPHTRASLEPGTSGFSTLHINHYGTRGDKMGLSPSQPGPLCHSGHAAMALARPGPLRPRRAFRRPETLQAQPGGSGPGTGRPPRGRGFKLVAA